MPPMTTMASLNNDGVVVRVHPGRCNAEYLLTLDRTPEDEKEFCRQYLAKARSDDNPEPILMPMLRENIHG